MPQEDLIHNDDETRRPLLPQPYQPPPTQLEGSSTRTSSVLVRLDGSGICIDGQEHMWKPLYPA
ncbi:hypothetical protein GGI17_005011, partial [Coemansia sp. S146]